MFFSRGKKNKRPRFVDVHSHVSFSEYDHDRGAVIDRMRLAEIRAITVGVDLASSKQAVAIARQHKELYAIVGLHPTDTKEESFNAEDYYELADSIETVGIGECGLDYYRIEAADTEEKERQKKEFKKQIDFALEAELPLMLHCRPQKGTMDAYENVLEILAEYKKKYGDKLSGNVHFFVGNKEIAQQFITLGFTLSFTGVITFTHDYDAVIKEIPLEKILTETDSPYATPNPHRGKRNEPIYVQAVVKRIAELKSRDVEEVREQLVENAYRTLAIPE